MPVHSTMMSSELLLSTLMDRGARMQPDNTIVTMIEDGYHEITYSEHQHNVHRLAAALRKFGVQHGETCATLMWNSSNHLACYHAIPCMGYVLHPINLKVSIEQLQYVIAHAGDRIIFVDADMLPKLEKCDEATLSGVDLFVIAGDFEGGDYTTTLPSAKCMDWNDFLASADGEVKQDTPWQWPVFAETSAAAIAYTSGTTGNPKGVVYSHRSTYLHTQVLCQADVLALSGADVLLQCPAMYHANSWGLPYATCMLGTKVILPSRYNSDARLLQCVVDHQVTVSCGVPSIWQNLRSMLQEDAPKYRRLLKLNRVCCGGASLPAELMMWYDRNLGVEFIQQWGMTETSPFGTFARQVAKLKHTLQTKEEQLQNVVPVGLPLPGLEFSIRQQGDLDMAMAQDGEAVGELLVRGPWVTGSYHGNAEASGAPDKFHVDPDGRKWLVTGDMASLDLECNVILRDRSKDLIKSGGEWISSVELENHISGLPEVAQACVVAQKHPLWEERPVAIVVAQGGATVDKEKVLRYVAATFEAEWVPDDVLVWNDILMTSTGKLDKKGVRAELQKQGYVLPSLCQQAAHLP